MELIHTREIVTMHNDNGNLNAAFTTFERFYTDFLVTGNGIEAVNYLEDKPVHVGETYNLEVLVMNEDLFGLEFFEKYTQLLHDRHNIKPMKPTPAGWSSWSCFYYSATEDNVYKQAQELAREWKELGADLVQLDDSWQKEYSFGCYWTHNDRFRHDIPWLVQKCRELGLRFGIWMAPGFVIDQSGRFDELFPLLQRQNGKLIASMGQGEGVDSVEKNGSTYTLDIGKEEVLEMTRDMFRRGKEEYGAVYFKVDFIVDMLIRCGRDFSRVEYPDGYSVELYRNFMKEIRKVVGEDTFLLACGAPIGEATGIFDSIRVSPDITWGDALVFNLEEAKMWVTVAAMTGGQLLINEEIDQLSRERKDLFTNILPPLGMAARPRDFYEFPWCSETFIDYDEDTQLCAIYNWGEEPLENFYLGLNTKNGKSYYYYPTNVPEGYEEVENEVLAHIYVEK